MARNERISASPSLGDAYVGNALPTLGLADRIAFLNQGQVLQISRPQEMVENPAHPVVASAIDPFFRVRLDGISPTSLGFRAGPVEFRGLQMPAGADCIVINTRKIIEKNGGTRQDASTARRNSASPGFSHAQ